MFKRICLLPALLVFAVTLLAGSSHAAADKPTPDLAGWKSTVRPFLEEHCIYPKLLAFLHAHFSEQPRSGLFECIDLHASYIKYLVDTLDQIYSMRG